MKFFGLLIVFASFFGAAQHPTDYFQFNNPNIPYLEHLTKIAVDSVRQAHHLPPLPNDSILYRASQFHASYLIRTRKLSHNQTDQLATKTPQLRAESFGAKHYLVGENLAKTYAHKPIRDKKGKSYINQSYGQIARNLVRSWVSSPGHFANLLTPSYNVTALAIGIDSAKQEIKAVQKFAEIQFKYNFPENTALFPYTTYTAPTTPKNYSNISRERIATKFQWGLKAPKDSLLFCTACNTAVDTNIYKNKLYFKGKKIMFYSPNIDMMHALMNSPKSGLAIEIVEYKHVDCGNPSYYFKPSRRNNQSVLNGSVLKPVYRKNLKKGFKRSGYKWYNNIKKKGDPTHFEYSLGKLPKTGNSFIEANILVIHKKKVCRVMHFSNVCGDPIELLYDIPYLTKLNKYQFGINPGTRNIAFSIPFKQGKFMYDYTDIKPLIDSITSESFTVESASIQAYSSLEGDKDINHLLQQKRARNIIRALEDNQRSKIDAQITTDENWALFDDQIESENKLKPLKGLTRADIRQKLNDRSYAKSIEHFLAKQRYGKVNLTVKFDVTNDQMGQFLVNEFARYKDSVAQNLMQAGMSGNVKANLDTMASIQWYTYHLIKAGKIDTILFEDIVVPVHVNYAKLIKDHLWYDLDLNGGGEKNERWEASFYNQLNKLNRLGISSFEIRFDVMNYLLRNWKRRPPYGGAVNKLKDNISALQQQASNDSLKKMATELWVNYHVANAKYRHFSNRQGRDDDDMRTSMIALQDHFLNAPISDENRFQLAKFFIWGEQEDLAFNLLENHMNKEKPYVPSLILYAKLLFSHPEEWADITYVDFLISIKEKLSVADYCDMFVGPCNISFQVLDYEPLRQFYCETCAQYKNYAQKPEDWEK